MFSDNSQVAFGVELELLKNTSQFPKAIDTVLKGLVSSLRDEFFQVWHGRFVWSLFWDYILKKKNLAVPVQTKEPIIHQGREGSLPPAALDWISVDSREKDCHGKWR